MAVYDAFTDASQQDMIGGYGISRFYFMIRRNMTEIHLKRYYRNIQIWR